MLYLCVCNSVDALLTARSIQVDILISADVILFARFVLVGHHTGSKYAFNLAARNQKLLSPEDDIMGCVYF